MTRWLLVACVGIVAVGFGVRMLTREDAGSRPASSASGDSARQTQGGSAGTLPALRTAPPLSSPEAKAMQERLLKDDTLPPPPADAPADVKRTYETTVKSIAMGNDPLLTQPPPQPALSRESMLKRIEERKKVAQERAKEMHDVHKKKAEEQKKKHLEQRTQRELSRDPSRPIPPPLFETPKLGPPLLPDGAQPKDGNTTPPDNSQPPP